MSNVTNRIFTSPYLKSLIKTSGRIIVVWFVVLGCGLISVLIFGKIVDSLNSVAPDPLANLVSVSGDPASSNQLLAIKVQGVIVGDDTDPGDLSVGGASVSGYDIKSELYSAAQRSAIKGILLEIDSPGGTIYGARAIADGVKYYRDTTHNPVYAHIEGTGASGAYWAATSANKIIADYGSDTGSIGVIMGPFEYYDDVLSESDGTNQIVTQNGIQSIEITAGRSKDIGNPYRKLTAEETAELQQEVNDQYGDFVSYVSQQRHIQKSTITEQLGAMAYDDQTAQADKLIDSAGSREDALSQLAQAAGISGSDYQVMEPESASSGAGTGLLGAFTRKPAPAAAQASGCPLASTALAYEGDVTQLCKP